ncbi:AraC family transcriptional regulator [Ornithinibacillus sp. 179-J 7C1 HS]|uniref:AraC family transcriptional regulator n=1 Tax=Ornithinibacillus sp. 179-J 7C1 HS TaxID=3142384 RepID=UPI0039A16853
MQHLHQVICEKRTYTKEFQSHQHDFGQFLFPLQGTLDIQTDWQAVNLNSDYCFYLPPNCDHLYRSVDRNEFLILDIPIRYLPEETSSMYIRLDKQWDAIRYLLLEEARRGNDNSSLVDLTRYVTNKLQVSNSPSIDYIHKHYKESIKVETLAMLEHYHPTYYSAWFKKKTGKSPKAYISDLRLQEAKHLLLSSDWSMSAISEELGFENSSSFTRWFVGCEGVSPQKYRMLING